MEVQSVRAPKLRPRRDLPDLVVSQLEPDTYFPGPGTTVSFDVAVKNQGAVAAGPFNVALAGDDVGDKQRVPSGLAPGQELHLKMGPLVADGGLQSYDVVATADSDNEVVESDKHNNTKEVVLWNPDQIPPTHPPYP